jgi:hypothetical protein
VITGDSQQLGMSLPQLDEICPKQIMWMTYHMYLWTSGTSLDPRGDLVTLNRNDSSKGP